MAATVTQGQTATFTAVATGSPTPTYQWQKNTTNIAGATNATLTLANAQSGDAASYRVVATNSVSAVPSNAVALTVNVQPAITVGPVSATVSQGNTAIFSVTATGSPTPTYQWLKNSVNISGATNATLALANVQPADAASYSVVVTNSVGSVVGTATLTVNVVPAFTTQPAASTTAFVGQAISLTAVATGTPAPTLQWRKASVPIAGATNGTLSFSSLQTSDAGIYDVLATNPAGAAQSTTATVTVAIPAPPTITTQPAGGTRNIGDIAAFSVVATSTPAPTYQWRRNSVPISGATSSSYVLGPVDASSGATFDVVVTNGGGSVTSSAAVLVVNPAVFFTQQPTDTTKVAGTTVTLSAAASGSAGITYQWRKNSVAITGATLASLTFASVQLGDAGPYDVVATSSLGTATSPVATLTVVQAPAFTSATSTTFVFGTFGTFTITASGTPAPTFSVVSGVLPAWATLNSATGVISGTPNGAPGVSVTLQAANGVSPAATQVFTLNVALAPFIQGQPSSVTVVAGQNASFSVSAGGTPVPTLQWRKGGVGISGATNSTYSLTPALLADAGSYDVVVTNSLGSVTSTAATLTVTPATPPTITTQPIGGARNLNEVAAFSVVATGFPAPTYQWRKNNVPISGATNSSYVLGIVSASSSATFDVVVTNAGGTVTSDPAVLVINPAVFFALQPASATRVVGTSVTLAAAASGSAGITYQWRKNSVAITGATLSTLAFASVQTGDTGPYDVVATSSSGTATSTVATLTVVDAAPTFTLQPVGATLAVGGNVTLSAAATGSLPLTYQWRQDGVAISGATNASLDILNAQLSKAGVYDVVATNGAGTATSTGARLVVGPRVVAYSAHLVIDAEGALGTFTVEGTLPKKLLLRAIGPGLASFGLGGMFDPQLEVFDATGSLVAINNDWGTGTDAAAIANLAAAVGAFPLVAGSRDSAMIVTLAPGTYTARAKPASGGGGAAYLELYDADLPTAPMSTLPYLAIRGRMAAGGGVVIGGLGSNGRGVRSYLVRAVGPALGVAGAVANPSVLVVRDGTLVGNNDDWDAVPADAATVSAATARVATFALPAAGRDAALVLTGNLHAGSATVQLGSADTSGGLVLLELHDLDATRPASFRPVIVSPPLGTTANTGDNVVLKVLASGSGALGYQWRKEGVPIAGATLATLSLAAVQPASGGNYSVVVSSALGAATSLPATLTVQADAGTSAATHAYVGAGYMSAGTITITNKLTYTGSPSSLGWHVDLPAGWSFVSASGTTGDVKPEAGVTGTLDWAWSTPPASPVTFTYTLSIPAGGFGAQQLKAYAIVRTGGTLTQPAATSNPLVVPQLTTHSADTDADFKISLLELTRVIELFNTRNGTQRTGCYAVATAITEDGFDLDSTRAPGSTASLTRYHSVDENRDGRIDLLELTRIIELFNYRSGTQRTGQYHAQPGTEDGFDPGP